jgi:glycoside/pentoside/hexuronide:cation symporter, GPH family
MVGAWLMLLYCPPEADRPHLMTASAFGAVMFLLGIPSALADPIVGHFSDQTRSRWGRRMPYIIFGTPFLVLSFVLMWFPPVQGLSTANTVWMAVTVLVFYLAFTAVVNPYLAIMPEVWQSDSSRVSVSVWMSVTNGIGVLFASLAGLLIAAIPAGEHVFGIPMNGYTVTALFFALATVVFTYPTAIWVRETPHSADKEVPFSIFRSGWETLKNPAFLPYLGAVTFINTSTTLVVALLPYQVKVLAGSTEGAAGVLMAVLMVLAIACFPLVDKLAARVSRRSLFLGCCLLLGAILTGMYFMGVVPNTPIELAVAPLGIHLAVPGRLLFGVFMLALAAPAVAVFLAIPRTLLADVMDYDQKRTGYRREAMYNGMESLIAKVAIGLAPAIMGFLFDRYGYTVDRPQGIQYSALAGAVLTFLAFLAFLKYPLRDGREAR